MTNATNALARFICETDVDLAARAAARDAILDTMAVTVAGSVDPAVAALASTLTPASDQAAVDCLWTRDRYRPEDAALLTGMASHVLDYDDVCMLAICHPSAPVLSALLCAAPWDKVIGHGLCDAHAIGTEVMIRIGEATGLRMYQLGFHATAVLGAFGATAAVARLRQLDVAQTANALALAASLASGLKRNFGSMAKPLHVGIAAANGIRAATWSAAGIKGAETDVFDGVGFLMAFSGGQVDHWPADVVCGSPFVIVTPGFEKKRFPCCYMLHRIIAASLALGRDQNLDLDQISTVRVTVAPGGSMPLIHPRPVTGRQAQFSGPYAVLAAIQDRRIDFDSFTDEAVLRPQIQSRLSDVEIAERNGVALTASQLGEAPITVAITLRDGRVLACEQIVSPGSPEDPLTTAELQEKWADCLCRASAQMTQEQAAGLFLEGWTTLTGANPSIWLGAIRKALRPPLVASPRLVG